MVGITSKDTDVLHVGSGQGYGQMLDYVRKRSPVCNIMLNR